MAASPSDPGSPDEPHADPPPDPAEPSRRWRPTVRQIQVLTSVHLTGTPGPTTGNQRVGVTIDSLIRRGLIQPTELDAEGGVLLYRITEEGTRARTCGYRPAVGDRVRTRTGAPVFPIDEGCVKRVSNDGDWVIVCEQFDTIHREGFCIHRCDLKKIGDPAGPCDCIDPPDGPCR
jgi:hypothetical protein